MNDSTGSPDASTSPVGPTPPPLPNPYDLTDPAAVAAIKKRIDEKWKVANHRRWLLEVGWLRQVLFALDVQWIRVDAVSRSVRNATLAPGFPRAITNKYAQVNGDLWAQLVQGDIPVNWLPSTDDQKDQATADICERVREVVDAETKTRPVKRDLGFWETYTGNGFIECEYDYDPQYGTVPVGLSQCNNCGATSKVGLQDGGGDPAAATPCPGCGPTQAIAGLPPPTSYSPAMQPDGVTPQTEDMPIGKLMNRPLSPFEVYWDNVCRIGAQPGHQWYISPRPYDVEVAKATWPDAADKINENMNETMRPSRNYLIAIAYAGSYLSGAAGYGGSAAREEGTKKQITAWRFKELPSPQYPQGVYAVRIGDEIVDLKPLPNVWGAGVLKGQPFLGLVHFYQEISGGAWGKARASRMVGIQARRNIIESNLQLTAQRTGAPKLMSPMGAGLKNVTGESGQIVEYKPITFGGTSMAEPHYLEAALGNVQPLVELIKMLDDMQETIAGTHSVTGGDTPPGVTAASALAFLSEKANRAISPLKESWAENWGTVYQYDIEIARAHWTDPRILAILGRNKEWEFQKFKASDLTGSVNVSIDYEALYPKSQATERANLMALVQMMAVNPSDPETRYEILKSFGETKLEGSKDDSINQAIREYDAFMSTGQPPMLLPIIQDAIVHLQQHKKDATSQEFELLLKTNKPLADIWIAHIQATMMAVIQASLPMAPPPGPGGPPHGAPPPGPGGHAGSQPGAAHGNLADAAPIKKGASAADGGAGPAGPPG